MSATIKYKGETIATASNNTKTLLTAGKYMEANVVVTDTGGGGGATLQTKSVSYTPSETAISDSVTPDVGYDGMDQVNVSVGAISSTYVGSGIARKDSTDLTASGATVTAPSGYYSANATKTIPNATLMLSDAVINLDGSIEAEVKATSGGYVSQGNHYLTVEDVVTMKGAQTYYPSSSDQSISEWQYLTGAQTIKGVTTTNLSAANIKKDVVVQVGDSADPDRIVSVTGTYEGGVWVEETITTSGAVTKALDPYVLYHFTGALTSLTITLNAPSTGQIAHYHFDFLSGSTAPTLTMPNSVTMPDSFSVEASKRYEIDVLNNFGTVVEWAN